MERLELSDIYPVAFLCCLGFNYELQKDINPLGKKRVVFVFDKDIEKAREAVTRFYASQGDEVSANKYARALKELKSVVHNY